MLSNILNNNKKSIRQPTSVLYAEKPLKQFSRLLKSDTEVGTLCGVTSSQQDGGTAASMDSPPKLKVLFQGKVW